MSFALARFDPDATYPGFKAFDCGHAAIDKFVRDSLRKQVRQGLSVAYAAFDEQAGAPGRFAGFFTLSNHAIALDKLSALQLGSLPRQIPCVRLAMLGVNRADAGAGLGRQLMNLAFDLCLASAERIGSFGLYLDGDPGALAFYRRLGFTLLEGDLSPAPSPRFIPLSALRAASQESVP